ncbi:hypothetical protein [Spirosoma sp.]|uniref:hypothetical protein n=1 Tax=Spirosoma sp. TaxID=1899569 RepID=UPI003B3BB9E9
MAEQEKSRFEYDDWVGAVRPDPRNTDKLTLLQGYIGQSSEAGHIRVYSDETLNSFVEVPEESIVYAQKLSSTESSLGGSKLWLRSDSVVTYGDPKAANRPKSTFLEGDIMQQYAAFGQPDTTMMGAAMPAGGQADTTGAGPQPMATSPGIFCPVTNLSQLCPTRFGISVCNLVSCNRTICQYYSCHRTICAQVTCRITVCAGKTCFHTVCCIPTDRFTITPTTPQTILNPGGGMPQAAGQPDTTMGGYYGMFNPYMY